MTWVAQALSDSDDVSEAVGDRIYEDVGPDDATYPFIVYSLATSQDVVGLGTQRIMADTMLTVKAVAEASREALSLLAAAIDTALTVASGVITTDGTIFTAIRQTEISYTERVNGHQIRHLGGEFSIQVQSN